MALCLVASVAQGQDVPPHPAKASLIAATTAAVPGETLQLALRLQLDDHWHVYWRNAGDSGTPPELEWTLPDGVRAEPIAWPTPTRIDVPPLTAYGYEGDVVLPVRLHVPDTFEPGDTLTLAADAYWLVCLEVCIPGDAKLSLSLPVAARANDDQHADLIAAALADVPPAAVAWSADVAFTATDVTLQLHAPDGARLPDSAVFFPYSGSLVEHAAPTRWDRENGTISLTRSALLTETPEFVDGVLVADSPWTGEVGEARAITIRAALPGAAAAVVPDEAPMGLARVLAFAFVGGLILNLMPCVLPVLSLKVLGLVEQAGEGRRAALAHGLAFAAGVVGSFWVLAGALIALRAGGAQLGWGFQLQSPPFVLLLGGFMFLFGLNLLGVFEVGTSLTRVDADRGRGGLLGAALSGVTATVVATPCTAPFMGSALGYAVTQPPAVSLFVFTLLGLGMAAPYILLAAMPGLLSMVPRPGPWMVTLKQVLGFVLMATVVWLAWVLGIQAGVTGLVVLMAMCLVLAIGAWLLGRGAGAQGLVRALAVLIVLGAFTGGAAGVSALSPSMETAEASADGFWQPYDAAEINRLRADGTPVFVDFTAAWCLSCKVNERVALDIPRVRDRFADKGVVAFKADWTSRDAEITSALAAFGRNSVPLYVLYGADPASAPVILPELLTPDIVLNALDDTIPAASL